MKPGGRGGDSARGMALGIASTSRLLPGSRASRLRASRSYSRVLALVVGSFVFAAAAPDSRWATSVLVLVQSATLVVALWTSGVILVRSRFVVGLAALSAAAAVAQLLGGGAALAGGVALLSGLLVLVTIVVIAVGVMDQSEVNSQAIRGAICIYLLLGMLFVFVYGALAVLGDGHLFAQGTDGTRSLRVYFSFVTLATLGYGDYTAAGELGRTVSIVEALAGQLYLVTVVALLVAQAGRRPRRAGDSPDLGDERTAGRG